MTIVESISSEKAKALTDEELLTAYGQAYYAQLVAFKKMRPGEGNAEWCRLFTECQAIAWELKRRLSK